MAHSVRCGVVALQAMQGTPRKRRGWKPRMWKLLRSQQRQVVDQLYPHASRQTKRRAVL